MYEYDFFKNNTRQLNVYCFQNNMGVPGGVADWFYQVSDFKSPFKKYLLERERVLAQQTQTVSMVKTKLLSNVEGIYCHPPPPPPPTVEIRLVQSLT